MDKQTFNPFEDEKPQIVHFEKNESHYEYCRMQMHDIEQVHRRTFIANFALCIVVCFLAVFRKYVGGFGVLSMQYADIQTDNKIAEGGAFLAGGIFQILIGMVIIVLGYLAWANFRSLNIILETWYAVIAVYGIIKLDYISALVGVIGAVFYFFSLREMRHEQALSEMEGYPEFQEKFDISKSDIVVQTLLAHKGEQRTKSTLFTTDYSLRRKKKKSSFGDTPAETDKGKELAEELQKRLDEVKDARQARTAIASLDAVVAEQKREKEAEKAAAAQETAPAEPEKKEISAESQKADTAQADPEKDAQAEADAIIAAAEAKAKALLAEAEAKANAMKQAAEETEKPAEPEKAEKPASPAKKPGSGNPQKKRKKR